MLCDICGVSVKVPTDLGGSPLLPKCERGHDLRAVLADSVPVGFMICEKAIYEYHHDKDFSMTIVLAAMAFESQIYCLYRKWATTLGPQDARADETVLDEALRSYRSIELKIDAVAKLAHAAGLDDFVGAHPDLRRTVEQRFTSFYLGTLPADFQRSLFWPRNKILHCGFARSTERDARRCLNIARLGIGIFESLDDEAGRVA